MARKRKDGGTGRLLIDPSGQTEMFDKSYEQELREAQLREVQCLGMTFPNDDARRAYFLDRLREHLQDPEFRKIEGFPIGTDEDILALSDPPYYTACPNPFVAEFVRHYGRPYDQDRPYLRKPFAADVSEGKNDPIYNAHSYHTKVPHKAIMRYVIHYTEPGDVVFDGFCGTGMTGIAAQLCGDEATVRQLGYAVQPDGSLLDETRARIGTFGVRHAILKDLSPAATHIARTYNLPRPAASIQAEFTRIARLLQEKCRWMYLTTASGKSPAAFPVTYTIWSDVFACPHCGKDIVFWNAAVDSEQEEVRDDLTCPHCRAKNLTKGDLVRMHSSVFDPIRSTSHRRAKRMPVLIEYLKDGKRITKVPDSTDFALIEKIDSLLPEAPFPDHRIDRDIDLWYERDYRSLGVDNVYDFFTRRALICLSTFRSLLSTVPDPRTRAALTWVFTSVIEGTSLMNRERPGGMPSKLSGTLYIGALIREIDPIAFIGRKVNKLLSLHLPNREVALIETASTSDCSQLSDNSIDYIFVDPPFGSNIIYSDLSILWEAWLNVYTNTQAEAVVHRRKKEGAATLGSYLDLMAACFAEMCRILKPGRWITVEFHNTKSSVWNAIQESLLRAGLVIADVRTLDKKQGSFKQVTAAGAVKQDLVISAYKPNGGLEDRFRIVAGSEEGVWDFVRTHLNQLPVFVSKDGQAEIIAERQDYLLFDRMVAFHVQRGVSVPLSAGDFYPGLSHRFAERDGMYFQPEQVVEYDRKRMTVKELVQLDLFVTDEASAIQWLKQQLTRKPQSFQDLHPQFLKEIGGWSKHERPLELSMLLEDNFVRHDGKEEVPSQIHSYLSTNYKELRNKSKEDPGLIARAKDRWYVPDPRNSGQLEKLREKSLLREFDDYKTSKGKALKVFRVEAMRAGFKRAYDQRDYQTIVDVADKIPESVLQEDEKLLMYFDVARTRLGREDETKLF